MRKLIALSSIALLGLLITGCERFEPDPEIVEKARILNEEGKIEIDGIEYCAVEGYSTHKEKKFFYALGPLGKTLYGHDSNIEFFEIPNELGYTVLTTTNAGSPFYVETTKKEAFISKVNESATIWVCSYTNPKNTYTSLHDRLDDDKCELINNKYTELKGYINSTNEEDKETINTESKENTIYSFCRYTFDESFGLTDSLIQILKVEDSYHLIIEYIDNVNNYVCYKGDEEFNSFFAQILNSIK